MTDFSVFVKIIAFSVFVLSFLVSTRIEISQNPVMANVELNEIPYPQIPTFNSTNLVTDEITLYNYTLSGTHIFDRGIAEFLEETNTISNNLFPKDILIDYKIIGKLIWIPSLIILIHTLF